MISSVMDNESPPSFDRATYAPGAAAGPRCANCQAAIRDRYWRAQNRLFCAACHVKIAAVIDNAHAQASFGKALLLGGLTALGCGIAYAIFVQVSGIQLALVTIGIAFVIAKVVRKVSGLGGRRFQILAVVLTYIASAMGYAGPVMAALTKAASKQHDEKHDGKAATPGAVADDHATAAPPADDANQRAPAGAGGLLVGLIVIFGFVLAAPVLAATQAPLGLVIVLIGLWEAWKLSRPIAIAIEGPYDLSGGTPAT
jgi:hypothetical protein